MMRPTIKRMSEIASWKVIRGSTGCKIMEAVAAADGPSRAAPIRKRINPMMSVQCFDKSMDEIRGLSLPALGIRKTAAR